MAYWDTVAMLYDDLYSGDWSGCENEAMMSALRPVLTNPGVRIVDLACGTGLGYELCCRLQPEMSYIGIDLSEAMLGRCRAKHPETALIRGSLSELSCLRNEVCDVVLSLFSSLSYSYSPAATVGAAYRMLRPGGAFIGSCLSRHSLRRLLKFARNPIERYRTRGDSLSGLSTPAWTLTRSQLVEIARSAGFREIRIIGVGVLGGVLEAEFLWKTDHSLARILPCNLLTLCAVRP